MASHGLKLTFPQQKVYAMYRMLYREPRALRKVALAVGYPYPPCTVLLQDLPPMELSDLVMDTHHRVYGRLNYYGGEDVSNASAGLGSWPRTVYQSFVCTKETRRRVGSVVVEGNTSGSHKYKA